MAKFCKSRTRGAASVEAVVVLPIFVLLLIGLLFVRDLTGARLAADQEVRRCSWQYALENNCETKPPGCDGVLGDGHHGELIPEFKTAFARTPQNGTRGYLAVQRILENFVDQYLAQAVTRRFDADKVIERERPRLFGGGKTRVHGKYAMACNVAVMKQENVIDVVWDEFKP